MRSNRIPHVVRETARSASVIRTTSTLFRVRLGREPTRRVSLALEGPGSTIFAKPGTVENGRRAQIRDVVGVLDELRRRPTIDLCKVNIEGGEYDLFDRLIEADWISPHPDPLDPVPRVAPERLRAAAVRSVGRFARTHDEVWDYPFVWEMWRRRT